MRCPKCGYISFDHVTACLKCNKDISKSTTEVEGTTYNVAPPAFLKFTKSSERTQPEEDETLFDDLQTDNEVIDPDLDVLVEEDEDEGDEAGISFGDDFEGFENLSMEEDIEIADEDEGEDIGLDLGQFEDAFEGEEAPEEDKEFEMEMPDELNDISDLSAPAAESGREEAASPATEPADSDLDDDFSLDLDLQELDEDEFSLVAEDKDKDDSGDDPLGDLSLDDLGLSETETEEEAKPKPKPKKTSSSKTDMDADLDFDLDLGGITLDGDDD